MNWKGCIWAYAGSHYEYWSLEDLLNWYEVYSRPDLEVDVHLTLVVL